MEIDSNSLTAKEQANSDPEIEVENEEVLVYVNFEDLSDDYSNIDFNNFQALGLETDEPILQIDEKSFGGNWKEIVGTAVFFEETSPKPKRCYFSSDVSKPLKYIAKTQKCLNLKRIFISPKDETPATKNDSNITQNEESAHSSSTENKKEDIETSENKD